MKKILLAIQGYKLLDEVSGLWKVQYKDMSGKDIVFVEYSNYQVYYNHKKDLYRLVLKGFKPRKHYLYGELVTMIDFLNLKPENDYFGFSETAQDYFLQKEGLFQLMNTGFGDVKVSSENPELVILRFDLDQDKEYIMTMRDTTPIMKEILQNFKKSGLLVKGIEIYEEHDNILITSEGYYVCTSKTTLNKLNNGDSEEENK